MPFVNIHPAPGLGEMLPGWFVVPNNPFRPRAVTGIGRGVGMMLPASFTVPSNPLIDALRTVGMPAGQTASMGYINGIGEISLDSFGQVWESAKSSLGPVMSRITEFVRTHPYLSLGAALLLVMMFARTGGRYERKAAKYEAKAEYYSSLARIKKQHPTYASYVFGGVSRAARGAGRLLKRRERPEYRDRYPYARPYWRGDY